MPGKRTPTPDDGSPRETGLPEALQQEGLCKQGHPVSVLERLFAARFPMVVGLTLFMLLAFFSSRGGGSSVATSLANTMSKQAPALLEGHSNHILGMRAPAAQSVESSKEEAGRREAEAVATAAKKAAKASEKKAEKILNREQRQLEKEKREVKTEGELLKKHDDVLKKERKALTSDHPKEQKKLLRREQDLGRQEQKQREQFRVSQAAVHEAEQQLTKLLGNRTFKEAKKHKKLEKEESSLLGKWGKLEVHHADLLKQQALLEKGSHAAQEARRETAEEDQARKLVDEEQRQVTREEAAVKKEGELLKKHEGILDREEKMLAADRPPPPQEETKLMLTARDLARKEQKEVEEFDSAEIREREEDRKRRKFLLAAKKQHPKDSIAGMQVQLEQGKKTEREAAALRNKWREMEVFRADLIKKQASLEPKLAFDQEGGYIHER